MTSHTVTVPRELLPCPFCGGADIRPDANLAGSFDQCWGCGARGPLDTSKVSHWNRRAQPAAEQDERAAFEAFIRRDWPDAPLHHVRDALPKTDPRYGQYVTEGIQHAWVGWQARAALASSQPTDKEQP